LENFEADCRLLVAMIDLEAAAPVTVQQTYVPIPRYPAIERDIAIVLAKEIEAGAVLAAILANGGKYIESAILFDVYEAAALGEGKKSLAYALTFRSAEGTLTEEQITDSMQDILLALGAGFGAKLRE